MSVGSHGSLCKRVAPVLMGLKAPWVGHRQRKTGPDDPWRFPGLILPLGDSPQGAESGFTTAVSLGHESEVLTHLLGKV